MWGTFFGTLFGAAAVVVRVLRVGAPVGIVHEASLSLAVREQRWWAVPWREWQQLVQWEWEQQLDL